MAVADVEVEVVVVSRLAGKAKAEDAAMPRMMSGRDTFIVMNSYQS